MGRGRLAAVLLAGWFVALIVPAVPASADASVTIVDNSFSPSSVAIDVGAQVTWTWGGSNMHSTTSDTGGLWDSGIKSSGSFSHPFSSAGSFTYHCNVHSSMHGTVNVGKHLTVSKTGSGSGTVSGTGISCGTDCDGYYASGDLVSLSASPMSGSTFDGWSGACSGTGTCDVTMSADMSVTATFSGGGGGGGGTHQLTVTKSGSGTVTSSPAGIDCGSTCSAPFTSGSTVMLTAAPDTGSAFSGWSGACSGMGACSVAMDSDKSVTATFQAQAATSQPDAKIKRPSDASYIGDDVYNTDAAGQTRTARAAPGGHRAYRVQVQNDGDTGDAFALDGCGSTRRFAVKYLAGSTNVTSALAAGTYTTATLAPGAARTITVVITARPSAPRGATLGCLIVATSTNDVAKEDAARAKLRVT